MKVTVAHSGNHFELLPLQDQCEPFKEGIYSRMALLVMSPVNALTVGTIYTGSMPRNEALADSLRSSSSNPLTSSTDLNAKGGGMPASRAYTAHQSVALNLAKEDQISSIKVELEGVP